jgi:hypothetical protein
MAASAAWSKRVALAAAAVLVALGMHAASAPSKPAQSPTAKTLTVTIVNRDAIEEGAPWGSVTSDPAGIDCPTTCSAAFEPGTTVQLTSHPSPGYSLLQWSPSIGTAGCDRGPTCSFTIDANDFAPSVEAAFQPAAELEAMTAGAGTLSISPPQPTKSALCAIDAQQESPDSSCEQHYLPGTRVTLTANPQPGARFVGWSDFACSNTSRSCTVSLAAGVRYVTARFSPVKLTVQAGEFGAVVVQASPGGTCTFAEDAPPCEFSYPAGTIVTLRREHAAPGNFWVGACDGNTGGLLDADVCRMRLQGNELVAAGKDNATAIPPARGSGIAIGRAGKGKGKVTGRVINDSRTLTCGGTCAISGLSRYDQVRLAAKASKGSRFVKWNDGSKIAARVIALSGTTRIKATFEKKKKKKSRRR